MTNDPGNFSRPETASQFRVKRTKGSIKKDKEHFGKSYLDKNVLESNYLNQQRQLLYLKNTSHGTGGGSKNMEKAMRPESGVSQGPITQ